ncbi:hypothetical protein [Streptomyces sp. NPDC006784]|uniref:hypothetical protein n=1 Tax=Streptomyces sp. NPDC006784 TaxID=3364764 RepID=UPI0036A4ABAA
MNTDTESKDAPERAPSGTVLNITPRMGLVFRTRALPGTPEVLVPGKCTGRRFWHPDELPEQIVPYTRAAIDGIRAGRLYTEVGWS